MTKNKQGPRRQDRSSQKFDIELRQHQVFELWKEGATLRAIGKALNISHETARIDRDAVFERIRTDNDHELHAWRNLQLARLHDQYMTFNALAKGKVDPATGVRAKPDKEAGRLVIRIIDQISEITGVKASVKHEITGAGGGPLYVTSSVDLTKLSTNELLEYEKLLAKANANTDA